MGTDFATLRAQRPNFVPKLNQAQKFKKKNKIPWDSNITK